MLNILTQSQSRIIDDFAIKNLSIPSIVLMENASRSAKDLIIRLIKPNSKILIICGTGNNGGDGLAIARHLFIDNISINNLEIKIFGSIEKFSKDALINYNINNKLNINQEFIDHYFEFDDKYEIVIDALIGTGGSENLKNEISQLLERINKLNALKIAIDIATGLNSDTGAAHKNAFISDITVTMHGYKLGLLLNRGNEISGKIYLSNIGLHRDFDKDQIKNFILEKDDFEKIIPTRDERGSKFEFGKFLIIAGSDKYSGAACLTANACISSGAGLVQLYSTTFHPSLLPEIIQLKAKKTDSGTIAKSNLDELNLLIEKSDCIVIGPGLGSNSETIDLIKLIISNYKDKKIVIDADGLKSININEKLSKRIILTPHFYEFCNLFGLKPEDTRHNIYKLIKDFSKKLNCTILLKYHPTIISDGDVSYFNINENSGMSTAGSGDVLTGIISYYHYLLDNSNLATSVGAFIHSECGKSYINKNNKSSLTASSLIEELKGLDFVK